MSLLLKHLMFNQRDKKMLDTAQFDFSTFPKNFRIRDFQYVREYVRERQCPCVAIFDIGTRAARLLVAPRAVPDQWERYTFYSTGYAFNLGEDVSFEHNVLPTDATSLRNVITFINAHIENLHSLGVVDISLIGTAIFRWLANIDAVKSMIKTQTACELNVIDQDFEGMLGLLSLSEVYKRLNIDLQIDEDDFVAFLDQGGGSFEISWMLWKERNSVEPEYFQQKFEALGTNALRRDFFYRGAQDQPVDPLKNKATISRRVELISRRGREHITYWRTPPRAKGNKIHAFAVGSAITGLLQGSTFDMHNTQVNVQHIEETLKTLCADMEQTNQQVLTLFKALRGLEGEGVSQWLHRPNLDGELAILYGLPVFAEVLKKIQLDNLTISGYGLRFGYYLWKYLRARVEPDATGPYVFVSYLKADGRGAFNEIDFLGKCGYRVWYDKGLIPSLDFDDQLLERVNKCEAFVLLRSAGCATSAYMRKELKAAERAGKRIVHVSLDGSPMPDWLQWNIGTNQYIERRKLTDKEYRLQLEGCIPAACKRL